MTIFFSCARKSRWLTTCIYAGQACTRYQSFQPLQRRRHGISAKSSCSSTGTGLQGNPIGNASTGYHNTTIQSLYTTLAAQGDASLTGAFEAGLAVEERDIADLDHALANTKRADIIQVWSSLRQGSENHKSAFLRQLGR